MLGATFYVNAAIPTFIQNLNFKIITIPHPYVPTYRVASGLLPNQTSGFRAAGAVLPLPMQYKK